MTISAPIIKDAIGEAVNHCVAAVGNIRDELSKKELSHRHRKIGTMWVRSLSFVIKKRIFAGNNSYLFYPDIDSGLERIRKKRYEYLFDIVVGRKSNTESEKRKCTYTQFISIPELIVESEFSEKCEKAVEDMAKLICANAKYRIFVGPYYPPSGDKDKNYLNPLKNVATFIPDTDNFYLALVSHPRELYIGESNFRVLRYNQDKWSNIS